MNKFFPKKFLRREDGSVYLQNDQEVFHYDKAMTERLLECRTNEALVAVQLDILRDYRESYTYDVEHARFPEPFGKFDSGKSREDFVRTRILLQDFGLYPGSIFWKFHYENYNQTGELPLVQLRNSVINYSELYSKAMQDYIFALKNNCPHAVSASFILPSIIERGLGIALQNRLLYKALADLLDRIRSQKLIQPLDEEEENYVGIFKMAGEYFMFPASEKQVMEKMYRLFVRERVLRDTPDHKMILVGKNRKYDRTLGSMIRSQFAGESILPPYLELMKDMFSNRRLNIRNCIMHGFGETYDYLSIKIVAVMFQLIWDIADGSILSDTDQS